MKINSKLEKGSVLSRSQDAPQARHRTAQNAGG